MQGIHTAQSTSKESVRNYARALFGWDSGSVSVWVLATRVETRPQASIIMSRIYVEEVSPPQA